MFERFLPTREAITQSRMLRWLGPRLHDPLLWHVNRRSVARGVAMGVFFGLMMLKKLKNVHPVFFFLAGGAVGAVLGLI